jgi:hypothetical protein
MCVTTLLLLAVALGSCGGDEASAPLSKTGGQPALARQPYIGVACRKPNSIACDRVGLAVGLRRPAGRLEASVAGHRVRMTSPGKFVTGRGTGWEGYLQPAGLRSGALAVEPERGTTHRWTGRKPVIATVSLRAHYRDGTSRSRRLRVQLHPGWG